MAERLLERGVGLSVWARRRERADPLRARGAAVAESLEALAAGSDVVMTCLPRPEDVEGVGGTVVATARPGTVLVEMSTIDVETSRRLAAAAAGRGLSYLDAPISGGPEGAARGTLTIMVGGDAEAFARVHPVLACLGTHIRHLGPAGSGHLAKLCNQILAGVAYAAIAEALVLGVKGGLDPAALLAVLSTASGRSRALEQAAPRMIAGPLAPAFTADLAAKDLACALATARRLGARLLVTAVAAQCYEELRGLGLGELDQAAVVVPAARAAGVDLPRSRQ
jgi:3-hydroxyisobutyrate dehydrogenase-like beta-hydroxyacid dehydrogenase